jgi:CRP-like cAMP-binding protein
MSFGVLLYSFAIGSLSSIVSTMDQQTEEMNQKLQILSSIKKEFNLNQGIYDKVRKVIKYDLSRNQKDKMNFLQELPNKLRIELSQIMHDKVIQNLYFFRDQPSDFFAYVAPLLKPVKFSQNDYLYKVQDMIDEMYFVAKGTVIFCLDKKYGEKEIREIKKNNNFGEIEMCLNEKLTFNIKIKSRNCELFVLKKNDFLRLSVNFKEFIENFLHKSLMKYLKFNEEKNKMIKEFETLMNKANNKNKEKEKEKDEEKKSKNSDKSSNHNHLIESERSKKNEEDSDSHMDDSENQNKNNLIDETSHEKSPSGNKSNRSKKSEDKSSDLSLIQLKEMKTDDGDLNEKLKKKIDKISNILEAGNLNLDGIEDDPKELLKKIKLETDLNKKNELVDKLEEIMKKVFEKNPKKN